MVWDAEGYDADDGNITALEASKQPNEKQVDHKFGTGGDK
jgi:hypothetical protein